MFDLQITFECPACKQINENVSFSQVVDIETVSEYAGSGSYFGAIRSVSITCTGCKVESEIDY